MTARFDGATAGSGFSTTWVMRRSAPESSWTAAQP